MKLVEIFLNIVVCEVQSFTTCVGAVRCTCGTMFATCSSSRRCRKRAFTLCLRARHDAQLLVPWSLFTLHGPAASSDTLVFLTDAANTSGTSAPLRWDPFNQSSCHVSHNREVTHASRRYKFHNDLITATCCIHAHLRNPLPNPLETAAAPTCLRCCSLAQCSV